MNRRMMLLSIAGLIFLGGCQPCPEKFVSLETLVADYNANASQVPKLWARARIRVTLGWSFSWGSTSPLAPGNAILLLDKGDNPSEPVDFVIIGKEIVELFRVGTDSTDGLYYCWAIKVGAWFGRTKFAGAPGVKAIPLDPLQLLEILGVTELPAIRAGAMPAVVMTLQNTPGDCAYVVRYLKPQPISGHLKIWREVYFRWSDTKPHRPYQIKLYDADGLCRVVAKVADYKPIATDTDSDGEDDGPIMPTDIRITFPAIKNVQTASSLHMRLSEMTTTKVLPSRKVFDFRSHLPTNITNPVQVDANCENK
jgi:hypothetical protein